MIRDAVIDFVEIADDGVHTYLKYKLDRIFVRREVTSWDVDDRPTEEVAFYYNDIAIIREGVDKDSPSEKSTESGILEGSLKTNDKTTRDETIPIPKPHVPNWIQSIGIFWTDGDVTDKEFTECIGYLVKEKIIEFDEPVNSETSREKLDSLEKESEVPVLVKQNTKWWTDDEILEEQFLENIKWLIKKNIIKVGNQ